MHELSTENLTKLKSDFASKPLKTLAKELGMGVISMKKYAAASGLSRPIQKKFRLEPLTHIEDLTVAYWWGFLLADGILNKKGCLRLFCSIKDEEHIKQLANLLNARMRYYTQDGFRGGFVSKMCGFISDDATHGKEMFALLGLSRGPKTYFPPDFSIFESDEQFLACFIGFVDGDGYIGERNGIQVTIHSNWFDTLKIFQTRLYALQIISTVKINSRGFAHLLINKSSTAKLKQFALKNKLPILQRKWNRVDESFVNIQAKYKNELLYLRDLIARGESYKPRELAHELRVPAKWIYKHARRIKRKLTL